jgi:hypothetical protein
VTNVAKILIVWNREATTSVGADAMLALANQAVAVSNQVYLNSQINLALELVHAREITIPEVNKQTMLSQLRGTSDGIADEVHTLRNQYMADFVALLSDSTADGYCGIASLMTSLSTSFAPSAFSVTARGCATGNLSFPHEVGHNLGAHHDAANASGGLFSNSLGWLFTGLSGRNYRTVMSYTSSLFPNATRIQYFSNPNVFVDGVATGNSGANNAYTLNQSAPIAVRFRDESGPAIDGTAPSASITSPSSGSTVAGTVAISATASDNVGVSRVEFRLNGSLIGSDSSAPYSLSWNSYSVANGSYNLGVVAVDAAGNRSPESLVSVNVSNVADTSAPIVQINSPADGATVSGKEVRIDCAASDNVSVSQLRILINGSVVASVSSVSSISHRWALGRRVADGSHTIRCEAIDPAGSLGQHTINVVKQDGGTSTPKRR